MTDRPGPGIRRHGRGFQAEAKYRGARRYAQFPLDASLREMQDWQADEVAKLRLAIRRRPITGTLEADVAAYLRLEAVRAMPTFDERTQHLAEWCAVFGTRRRHAITASMIEAQRDAWLTTPRADGLPLSASSVNKRLRALSNVWTKLDGRRADNPVLEVDEVEEPDPEARGLPYAVIEAILAAIPETAIGVKKDGTRTTGKNIPRPSKTKARLRVIAYTSIPHSTLKRLTRASVHLEPLDAEGQETGGSVLLPPRRKGKKHRRAQDKPLPERLPLIPPAAAAFRAFDRLDCWGSFSNSSMWKAFQRACLTLGLEGLRPYDFRHSFLTAIYDETRDLRLTGAFGGHRTDRTTRRYTMAAVAPHVQAAADKLAARLASGSGVRDAAHPEKP